MKKTLLLLASTTITIVFITASISSANHAHDVDNVMFGGSTRRI